MVRQGFTAREFSYLVKRGDYHEYFISDAEDDTNSENLRDKLFSKLENNLNISDLNFSTMKRIRLKDKNVYVLEKIKSDKSNFWERFREDFILRKANKNICKIYNVHQADRFRIIKSIKNFLSEPRSFYVCKLDIKHFYESIDRNRIFRDMKNSSILSYETKMVLEKLFNTPIISSNSGLPRGINISASLSEYVMRNFDKKVQNIEGVFYYARYVDDIIIFSTKNIDEDTLKIIKKELPEGLCFNEEKTKIIELYQEPKEYEHKKVEISFLGYKFIKYTFCKKKESGEKKEIRLKTTIDDKKIRKIKERIVKAFLDYSKNRNIYLLKDRLLFLSANYPIKTQRQEVSKYKKSGCLHGGIAYSYPLIDSFDCLKQLDTFLYQVIYTDGFCRLNKELSEEQKEELKKYSFYVGYSRRISRKFKFDHLEEITRCWE